MIASLHLQDNIQQLPHAQQELPVSPMSPEPTFTDFDVFHDYFGLHTIVKSIAAENAPEESEELEEAEEVEHHAHNRRDSLGSSDSNSEFSSESVEVADICFSYNKEVRARQAFSDIDTDSLSPLGNAFEPSGSKTNIPPSLFLNHTKVTTIMPSQLKKPQVRQYSLLY